MTKNERLAYAREKKGLSQQDLAEKAGSTQPYIAGLEKSGSFSLKKAKELAKFLDVTGEWIYWGDKENITYKSRSILSVAQERQIEPFGDQRWIDPNLSVMENLEKLINFKKNGDITEKEFIRIKSKIIPE